MSDPQRKSLAKKLAEVMAAVKRIPKRGRNAFHGYDYATEADLADAIRDELAARSVILVPDVMSHEMRDMPATKAGKAQFLTTVNVKWTFYDGDSDDKISFSIPGFGIDGEDKGGYKAMTGAEKYALMKFFLVPTGDDPEAEHEQPGQRTTRPAARPENTAAAKCEQVANTPAPVQPRPAAPNAFPPYEQVPGCISEGQMKRMFALSKEHGWQKEELRNVLGRYGCEHSNEVPSNKYEEICALIQSRPGSKAAKA